MTPRFVPTLLLVLAVLGLRDSSRHQVHAVVDPTYSYFPTAAVNDGRMLCLAGRPLGTMAGAAVEMRIGTASGSPSFEIGIFDGDTGKDASGQVVDPGGSWDAGGAELEYTVYADPQGDGTGTFAVGRWFGNRTNATSGTNWTASAATMPDDAWWSVTINTTAAARAPSGHYFYRLVVRLLDPEAPVLSNFKLRTSGAVSLIPGTIGLMGALNQYADGYRIYPTWTGDYPPADPFFFTNAPTTYDGTWQFFLDLGTSTTDLRFWDGDLDKGNSAALSEPALLSLPASADTDDPDSSELLPDFATLGIELPEGAQGIGSPEDDSFFDLFRRTGLEYTLTDPDGQVYRIGNPSGNLEWEQFRITTDAGALRTQADYSPVAAEDQSSYIVEPRLKPGLWRFDISGLDLGNSCFLRFDRTLVGVTAEGEAVTPLRPLPAGGTVWYDDDRDGVKDTNESASAGVVVDLLDSAGVYIESTTTAADGTYAFEVAAGTYTLRVSYANFGPGRVLLGLNSTTGGSKRSLTLGTSSDLNQPFGYGAGGTNQGSLRIAGTVWSDEDGDALQDLTEPGFTDVRVTLAGPNGLSAETHTDDTGSYEFPGLGAGTYTVTVTSTTLPSGLRQTYDPDGLGTAHQATLAVTSTSTNSGITFGYTIAVAGQGPYTTYDDGAWGHNPNGNTAGALLAQQFATVYPGGSVMIGGARTLTFTSASAIDAFLPQGGSVRVLTTSYLNPTSALGVLSGQVLALRLNVDFSASGVLRQGLGALVVQEGELAGYTVAQVLALCNTVLGGTTSALPAGLTLNELEDITEEINDCFRDGRKNTGYVQ